MSDPGPLLASGRDADVYALGDHAVLRRSRGRRSQQHEADVMRLARAAGYPVPAVLDLRDDGRDLILERIEGPTLLADLVAHPWRVHRVADLLAELLRDLHTITVTPASGPSDHGSRTLTPARTGAGDSLVHLDLHPLNVLASARGPVVIDWTNAGAGEAEADVAVTWLVLHASNPPDGRLLGALARVLRQRLLSRLLRGFDLDAVRRHLDAAAAWKLTDPNVDPAEAERMRRLLDREGLDPT